MSKENTFDLTGFLLKEHEVDMALTQEVMQEAAKRVATINEKTAEQRLIIKQAEQIAELEQEIDKLKGPISDLLSAGSEKQEKLDYSDKERIPELEQEIKELKEQVEKYKLDSSELFQRNINLVKIATGYKKQLEKLEQYNGKSVNEIKAEGIEEATEATLGGISFYSDAGEDDYRGGYDEASVEAITDLVKYAAKIKGEK